MEGLLTCKAKFQKVNKEGNADDPVDRISDLPDKIIQSILSSLGTKDAVRTSVLSRRWRSQWMSVTNLDFLEFAPNMSQNRSLFMDFVERVIALREPSDIDLFALTCNVLTDASRINSWVCSAVKHNFKHLLLQLHQIHEEPFELAHCLFTCETLRIAVIMADILLKLPSSIHFSNLKSLTLQYVVFPDNQSTQVLFSGLPFLEKLSLDRCSWWNVQAVTIALPMLKKLDIRENAADPDNCRFFILAENLKFFYYIGTLRNDYCIYDSESWVCGLGLWSTEGIIEESSRQREVAYRADRLLRGLSSVKELILTSYAFEVLTYSKELYACMPVLYKLRFLGFVPMGMAINFGRGTLAKFLQNLPCLELLKFQSGICLSGNRDEENWILDPVPHCFSSHLKIIQIELPSTAQSPKHRWMVEKGGSCNMKDEKDNLYQGINKYRASLNLKALTTNENADCLADKIADQFKNQPCTNTTGANTVPGTEPQFSNYPDLLTKCHLAISNTRDGTVMPSCVPGLVPSLVLTNFTQSLYSDSLNDTKYTGIGIGSEDNWIVVVLTTDTPAGNFAPYSSNGANLISKIGLIYCSMLLILSITFLL
ncbi:F-box-like domain superfamily [Sesbania bispinosa]|nr:F-box-like domain superfamily [Sesbania bispinosa]